MNSTPYDLNSDFYLDFVQRALENESSIINLSMNSILNIIGEVRGERVCDLACGEGYFARKLAEGGANVTGIDRSASLLAHARQRSSHLEISFVQDDAQSLKKLHRQTFDSVVCNLALMDIPDIRMTFQAVQEILRKRGIFTFSILHPCFETPFRAPDSPVEIDGRGNFVALKVSRYLDEGFWNSGGDGMRGKVGAYHRMLATYFNTLIESGFKIVQVSEPFLPVKDPKEGPIQKENRIPPILVVKAQKG